MTTDSGPRGAARPDDRVELAWNRSGLAFAAIGLVLLKRVLPDVPARPATAVPLLVGGLLAAVLAVIYREGLRNRTIPRRTELLLAASGAVFLGVLAFVVAVVA